MPNIRGTNNDDDIDVTNDDGTLNRTPQGSPIDNIRARRGNDTITISNSSVAGVVRANAGEDTVTIQGSNIGNIRLGAGADTLNFVDTSVSGNVQGDGGIDSLNLPVGTMVDDATFGPFTVALGGTYSLSSGTFQLPTGQTITYSEFENGTGIPCLTRNTRVETDKGQVNVQNLGPGNLVRTRDNRFRPIRWAGSQFLTTSNLSAHPKLRPVRIKAGALGNDLPRRDLLVSRQHRMLVNSTIARRMFGASVLIAANKLTELPGIFFDETVNTVEYFHLMLDRHEIIYAEGTPTESLYTGPEALKAVDRKAREEILTIFPQLAEIHCQPAPARQIPSGRLQRKLVARHNKNQKPIVEHRV